MATKLIFSAWLLLITASLSARDFRGTLLKSDKTNELVLRRTEPLFKISNKEDLKKYHLRRFFADGSIYGVLESGSSYLDFYPGISVSVGNNFFFTKGKSSIFIRLTWVKVGALLLDGLSLTYAPVNIGLGCDFNITDNFSIEPNVSGGLVFFGPSFFESESEMYSWWVSQVKLNFNDICISLEYSTQSPEDYAPDRFHYFSAGFGLRF